MANNKAAEFLNKVLSDETLKARLADKAPAQAAELAAELGYEVTEEKLMAAEKELRRQDKPDIQMYNITQEVSKMAQENAKRFLEKVWADETLRDRIGGKTPEEIIVEIAAEQGFDVTAEDLKKAAESFRKESAETNGAAAEKIRELNIDEMDKVAGGYFSIRRFARRISTTAIPAGSTTIAVKCGICTHSKTITRRHAVRGQSNQQTGTDTTSDV